MYSFMLLFPSLLVYQVTLITLLYLDLKLLTTSYILNLDKEENYYTDRVEYAKPAQ